MFIFHRTRMGTTEVFDIIISENSLPNSISRFGEPIRFNFRDSRHHTVGILVLIHDNTETEYILSIKEGLTEEESIQLDIELELLVGREVHCNGSDRIKGWFEHDALKS
jgi:hypothetical protein